MKQFALLAVLLFSSAGVTAQAPAGYYDMADLSSAQSLRDSLHEIIDDHTRYPYTSATTDTWDVLEIADESRENTDKIISLYRNASFTKRGGGNDFYNREHTWPKSYGFPDNGPDLNYPYTDMHHLFLADTDYNFYRSNKPYDNCGPGCVEETTEPNDERGGLGGAYPGDSNWTDGLYTQGRWETWLGRRGDVARALMYMDVRYAGGVHGLTGAFEPDLVLTDDRNLMDQSNTGDNEAFGYMGLLSVLLQWHQQDPVDLIEFQHHEAVASFQGNRNPFIDHPEWVTCVFEGMCKTSALSCDPDYVTTNESAVVVAATGVDDTVNLQCALDEATEFGFPVVRLNASTYYIAGILVEGFKGTLEGVTKVSSVIEILDGSIDCAAMENSGLTSSTIKFVGGEPRVRFVTIRAGQACQGDTRLQDILHFTGKSSLATDCSNDVIFGAVDRVIIENRDARPTGAASAILVSAEGNQLGGCQDTLLGTFKLNRSDIKNFSTGLHTTMKSGAQLDVNFNNFEGNSEAIRLQDTNQNTTITNNKITGDDADTSGSKGVVILTQAAQAPRASRVVINKNEFAISSATGAPAYAVEGTQPGSVANISAVISNNTFKLSGAKTRGVSLLDISNAYVSVNQFSGDAEIAVFVGGSTQVSGWTITANRGLESFNTAASDIFLDQTSGFCIVGESQGATVEDLGSENSVLTQF